MFTIMVTGMTIPASLVFLPKIVLVENLYFLPSINDAEKFSPSALEKKRGRFWTSIESGF